MVSRLNGSWSSGRQLALRDSVNSVDSSLKWAWNTTCRRSGLGRELPAARHPRAHIYAGRRYSRECLLLSSWMEDCSLTCLSRYISNEMILFPGTPIKLNADAWWDGYQPEGDAHEECGAMFYTGRLINISCDTRSFFICEHEADESYLTKAQYWKWKKKCISLLLTVILFCFNCNKDQYWKLSGFDLWIIMSMSNGLITNSLSNKQIKNWPWPY